MAWTDDRVEILTRLWGEGLSASQIARELGDVTRNAVIGKVHRLGLAGRASPTRPKSRITSSEIFFTRTPLHILKASSRPNWILQCSIEGS